MMPTVAAEAALLATVENPMMLGQGAIAAIATTAVVEAAEEVRAETPLPQKKPRRETGTSPVETIMTKEVMEVSTGDEGKEDDAGGAASDKPE